jgi:serine/threonine-protein kinase RsbW
MPSHPCTKTIERGSNWRQVVLRGPSTEETVESINARVMEELSTVGMAERTRFELQLALVEGLDNAVDHGNGGDPRKEVVVTCNTQPRRVTLTIDDQGDGFDYQHVPDPTAEENLLKEGGRGIFLIRSVADECRFEKNGARIVIIFYLP